MAVTKDELQVIIRTRKALQSQRSRMEPQWRDLTRYVLRHVDNWDEIDPNQQQVGDMREVYDSTAIQATETFSSGLQGYAYGQSVDWLSLKPEGDKDELSKDDEDWLQWVARKIMSQLSASQFYNEAKLFTEIGANLGTAVMCFDYDDSRGITEYHVRHPKDCLGMENRFGIVDTLFTDFWLDKADAIAMFGEDVLPREITDEKDETKNFEFHQLCCPSTRFKLSVTGSGAYNHIIYTDKMQEHVLKEWQTDVKDFAVWRWRRRLGGSMYGAGSPGLNSLSDIKMLNGMSKGWLKSSQLLSEPPIKKTRGLRVDLFPNAQIDIDSGQDFAPVKIAGDLSWTAAEMQSRRQMINKAYFVDFFLVLSQSIDRQKTATEVSGLQEEQSRIMSSFLSRLQVEFFEPIAEYEFDMLQTHGMLADETHVIPSDLSGKKLKIDFVSPLSRIQKRAAVLSPSRALIAEALQMAQVDPTVMDRINVDRYLQLKAEIDNADSRILKSDDEVKKIRQARAIQQERQQQLQESIAAAKAQADAYKATNATPVPGSPAQQLAGQMGANGTNQQSGGNA